MPHWLDTTYTLLSRVLYMRLRILKLNQSQISDGVAADLKCTRVLVMEG